MRTATIIGMLVMLTVLAVTPVKADVLALWLFDEGQGTTVLDDTGNGNDGEITNAKYVPGKYGTALKFDGDAFVNIGLPDSLQNGIVDAFTAEVWVKTDQKPPADTSTIIFIQVGGPIAMGFTFFTDGGLYGYAGGFSMITDPRGPDGIPVGEWFHFAQTYDGETQKLFFNGEEIASQDIVGAVTHTKDAWTIGAWSTQNRFFLEGVALDEFRVLNEALPKEELGFFTGNVTPVSPIDGLTTTWGQIRAHN